MTWLKLTPSSPGATRNSGTNGDLTTLLDWALPQASWTIEYSSGNARVYRPGSGNRFRLHVNHDSATSGSATLAVVRGCENASSATVLVDPFPTVAVSANSSSNWLISSTASTTTRDFIIYLSETFVIYLSAFSGGATWEMGAFGDVPTSLTDTWNTICVNRNATGTTVAVLNQLVGTTASYGGTPRVFWVRDISGATKSTVGSIYASGASMGVVASTAGMRQGYQNKIYREKLGINCLASTTTTGTTLSIIKRGFFPNSWNPVHNGPGTVVSLDTFTDTAYNPSASFVYLNSGSTQGMIFEETDTWAPPSG